MGESRDTFLPLHLQLARAVTRGYKLSNNNKKDDDSNTHTQDGGGDGQTQTWVDDASARFLYVGVLLGFTLGWYCWRRV